MPRQEVSGVTAKSPQNPEGRGQWTLGTWSTRSQEHKAGLGQSSVARYPAGKHRVPSLSPSTPQKSINGREIHTTLNKSRLEDVRKAILQVKRKQCQIKMYAHSRNKKTVPKVNVRLFFPSCSKASKEQYPEGTVTCDM